MHNIYVPRELYTYVLHQRNEKFTLNSLGKKTNRLHYGCYTSELCRCVGYYEGCDKECSAAHVCTTPCFEDFCNKNATLPTTTGTTVNSTITTKTAISKTIKMTTTNNATITHAIVQNGLS